MAKIDEISTQDYKRAFEAVAEGMTPNQKSMLRLHYYALNHTVTATKLAYAINFSTYTSVNLQYGRLSGKLCKILKVHPKGVKLAVLVEFIPREPGKDIQWILRRNVVKALDQLQWFKPETPLIPEEIEQFEDTYSSEKETTREAIVNSRLGQVLFRNKLIDKWHCCAVTGCENTNVLRASHIKPWKHSNNKERIDVYNGLLLIPNLDVVFDLGLITFQENGTILISKEMDSDCCELLGIRADMKIANLELKHFHYLKYHREHVFRN